MIIQIDERQLEQKSAQEYPREQSQIQRTQPQSRCICRENELLY